MELQERVRNYYEFLWARQQGLDDEVILRRMPQHLRNEVERLLWVWQSPSQYSFPLGGHKLESGYSSQCTNGTASERTVFRGLRACSLKTVQGLR